MSVPNLSSRQVLIPQQLRNSARGFFITGYCLGRRFLTRGSYRPGRRGLTTSSGISSPSSAPRNHLARR